MTDLFELNLHTEHFSRAGESSSSKDNLILITSVTLTWIQEHTYFDILKTQELGNSTLG